LCAPRLTRHRRSPGSARLSFLDAVRRLIIALVVVSALVAPGAASAAPIRECGNAGTVYDGNVRIVNVTSRVVRCRFARRFARAQMLHAGPACREDRWCRFRGWRCRHIAYRETSDIRCTTVTGHERRVRPVVRWQTRLT
jgi:hypothetical protein